MKLKELIESLENGSVEINGQVISVRDDGEVDVQPSVEVLAAQALDNLDVDKIIHIMGALNWEVATGHTMEIPDVDFIYNTAEGLIKDAIYGARSNKCERYTAETAGLRVEVGGDLDWVRISFVATESEAEINK